MSKASEVLSLFEKIPAIKNYKRAGDLKKAIYMGVFMDLTDWINTLRDSKVDQAATITKELTSARASVQNVINILK